jgi:SAM-dependent methyltransferase
MSEAIQDPSRAADRYRWLAQQCPICEEPPARRLGRRGGSAHRQGLGVECEIWQCRSCRLIFPNPMPVPANGLEQHYATDPAQFFQHHDPTQKGVLAGSWLEKAESIIGGKGRVLDVGAGRGELLRTAIERGWTAVGVEPSASFADHAERHSGASIYRCPLDECGFADESFDAVFLTAVLEHLYDPNAVVREIARILRRGGALYVDVPNEDGLYCHLGNFYQRLRGRDWVINVSPTWEPFHVFGFGPASLRALLRKHGLEVRDWRVYGGRSVLPSMAGVAGAIESAASRMVTAVSNLGELGTYIETWAVKA